MDEFFRYVTYIGDGIGSIIICVILLFVSYRFTLYGVISYITSGVFAQLIKHIFQTPRPKIYYEHSNIILNFVSEVSVYSFNSFPSGHAASAFSIFLILAVITKNKSLGLVYFLIASIVGLSRIYLFQHFFIDVYFGSIIGVIFAIMTMLIMNRSEKISSSKSLDNSIMLFFRK